MNYKIPTKTPKESKIDRIVSSPAISLGISARDPYGWYRKIQRRKPGDLSTRVIPGKYELPKADSKSLLSSRNVEIEKVETGRSNNNHQLRDSYAMSARVEDFN